MSQKNFFKGDKVQLKWNDHGTSLVVLAQTEVDKTGKSYYGETTLYLLSANGGFDSRIDLGKSSHPFRRSHAYSPQTRKVQFTTSRGHPSRTASPWYMATCQQRLSSSIPEPSQSTPSLSDHETRSSFTSRSICPRCGIRQSCGSDGYL